MKTIGLVGGVASGKTTVARHLADHGCGWVNADAIAHQVLEMDHIKKAVHERWDSRHGIESLVKTLHPATQDKEGMYHYALFDKEGRINRKTLAKIVFSDKRELEFLEKTMRPHVDTLIRQRIADLGHKEVIVLDIPLLYEAGYDKMCDSVWICIATRAVRFERYKARLSAADPASVPEISDMDNRDNVHLTPEEKQKRAHHAIRSDQPLENVCAFALKLLDVVTNPTVYKDWPNGLLVAEQAVHDSMDHENSPSPDYVKLWEDIDRLELHLKEEMNRRRL